MIARLELDRGQHSRTLEVDGETLDSFLSIYNAYVDSPSGRSKMCRLSSVEGVFPMWVCDVDMSRLDGVFFEIHVGLPELAVVPLEMLEGVLEGDEDAMTDVIKIKDSIREAYHEVVSV